MRKVYQNYYSVVIAILCASVFIATSCSEDSTKSSGEDSLLSGIFIDYIKIITSTEEIDGVVDSENSQIVIPTLKSLSEIEGVEYELADGVTINPTFDSMMGEWEDSCRVVISVVNHNYTYTLIFPDLEEEKEPEDEEEPEEEDKEEPEEEEDEQEEVVDEPTFSTLTLTTSQGDYTALIDSVELTITVADLTDLSIISGVEYEVADGVEITPSFESITGVWEDGMEFIFTRGEQTQLYKLHFPDEEVVSYTTSSENVIQLSLNESSRQQKILFVGTDIERSQGFIPNAANFDEVIQWGFGDVDFDVCRVSYDKKQELTEGEPNFAFYDGAVETMQAIKKVKPDVEFWATMKSDYSGYNSQSNLPDWLCSYPSTSDFEPKKYARFLTDYLEYMENLGLRIKYLSTAKEWTSYVTYSRAEKIIRYMNEYIEERGITQPLYIDACAWSTDQGYFYVKNVVNSGFESYYYGFSTHNYNDDDGDYDYARMVDKVNSITTKNSVGEQFYSFADETSGGTSATSGEESSSINSIINSFRNRCELFADGMNGELIFELYSRGYDTETRSIYIPSSGDKMGRRISNYYAFKTHGNWLEDDMYYYTTTNQNFADDTYTMTFASDSRVYMCVLNYNDYPLSDFIIDICDEGYNGVVNYHVMDDVTVKQQLQIEGIEGSTKLYRGKLAFEIPANSLVFFQINL